MSDDLADVHAHAQRLALIETYRAAIRVEATIRSTHRWRIRRLRRLEVTLATLAGEADRYRHLLGAPADAAGLAEILARTRPR